MLHHRPDGVSDEEAEARKLRLATMENLYGAYFATKPLRSLLLPAALNRSHNVNELAVSPKPAPTPSSGPNFFNPGGSYQYQAR